MLVTPAGHVHVNVPVPVLVIPVPATVLGYDAVAWVDGSGRK
jgi:hypothetical protein